jgi:glycerol uptake facilitator-like aquaporin
LFFYPFVASYILCCVFPPIYLRTTKNNTSCRLVCWPTSSSSISYLQSHNIDWSFTTLLFVTILCLSTKAGTTKFRWVDAAGCATQSVCFYPFVSSYASHVVWTNNTPEYFTGLEAPTYTPQVLLPVTGQYSFWPFITSTYFHLLW